MGRLRHARPSPGLVVAVLALIAALAGSAVAEVATTAKLNKKEKKQTRKIARKQINKLAPGLSVAKAETADTANSANSASPTGPAGGDVTGTYPDPLIGDQKVTTPKLANGAITTSKLGTVRRRPSSPMSVAAGESELVVATCATGEQAFGGGGVWSNVNEPADLHVVQSFPNLLATQWSVRVYNGTGTARNFTADVLCLEA